MTGNDGSIRHDDAAGGGTTPPSGSEGDRSLIVAVVIGFVLGAFSVIADGGVPSRALVIVGNIISPWAIAAFVAGRFTRSLRRGGLAGTLSLLIGVGVYYVGHGVRLAVVSAQPVLVEGLRAVPLVWLVAAVTIGPLLGIAGAASRRRPAPVVVIAAPGVVLLAETGFLVVDRRPWLWDLAAEPHRLTDLAIMIGILAIAVAIPIRTIPDRRRRLRVYGVMLVGAAAGSIALIGLYRLLVHLA